MGLEINALRFLLDAKAAGVSFDTAVTLGRQGLFVDAEGLSAICGRAGLPLSADESAALIRQGEGFCEPFLRLLGARAVKSMDVSAYQKASIVHDLNEPIPDSLQQSCSVLIDSGTLEHIFHFPRAIQNCMEMVRVGGHFLCITTGNNFLGHGFYQFSPELFFRVLSPANGFQMEKMLIYEDFAGELRFYEVADPQALGRRVTLINRFPTFLLVRARRIANVPIFAETPQQSDYVPIWKQFASGDRAADAGRLERVESRGGTLARAIWRMVKPFAPASVKRRVREVQRGPDPFDPQMYRRVEF